MTMWRQFAGGRYGQLCLRRLRGRRRRDHKLGSGAFFCATCPEPRRDEWLARTVPFRRYPIAVRAGGGTFTERLQARQLAPLR